MRVYLPVTLPGLAAGHTASLIGPPPLRGYAVTPGLREWHTSDDLEQDDLEQLEYAAMARAARGCLSLLAADPRAPRRRVVLVADVPDREVTVQDDAERGAVLIGVSVSSRWWAAAHVDAEAATKDVLAALDAAEDAEDAERGDEDASFALAAVADHELLWYAVQEIPELLRGG